MSTSEQKSNSEAEFDFAPFGFMNESSANSRTNIDIVKFLFSIWKPLIFGGCLGGLAGIGVYLLLGPVYSANTQVLVSKKASVPINDREANRFGNRGDHIELIKSDLIIEPAFKKHGLNDVPELATAYDPFKNIREGLSVSRSAGQESSFDNILDIAFDHPDKKIAATVVQSIVDSYREYLYETRDENSKQLYETLLEQQNNIMEQIASQEKEYREFRADAPVFLKASPIVSANGTALPPQSRYEVELASIEETQNENQIKQAGIEAKLAELERLRQQGDSRESLEFWVTYSLSTGTGDGKSNAAGGASALSGPPVKAGLDQQFLTTRLLEQRLLHSLGEEHSAVRNVRRQIDTILDAYAQQGLTAPSYKRSSVNSALERNSEGMDLVSVYEQTLKSQLAELVVISKSLNLMRADAEKKAKDAEMYQVEDQRLKDNISLQKTQLTQIFDQIATYDVSKEQEGFRMKQIAQVRIERSLKRVIKIVGAFGFMGIGLVFVLSYFREWLDTRIKTIDELCSLSATPLLGTIPNFISTPDSDRLAQASGLSPSLVFYHRPSSREAEAFRTIRTTLFHGLDEKEQVLQISSAEPGDGKSTAIGNIAIAMAQAGKRVLLIDCDLRRPTLHHLFGLPQEIGFTDILLNEIEWKNAIRSSTVEDLSIITAGLCPENPAEILSVHDLSKLFNEMRSEYDFILIDSPPVLAVSDPAILSSHVDGISIVARLMKNNRRSITRTIETLQVHGVRLHGILANGFDTQNAGSDSGYGYESYGSYFNEDTTAKHPSKIGKQPTLTE